MSVPLIEVLQYLVPGCNCVVWANDYERIVWNDSRPMPSKDEVEAAMPAFLEAEAVKENNSAIIAQIEALETTQTPRRMREAIAGTDGGWLTHLESQIAELRSQLIT